jgi:hypothetical protein
VRLLPGASGRLGFTLKAKDLVSKDEILSNPKINLSLDVSGVEVNGQKRTATSVAQVLMKANSDIAIIGKTQYSEGSFNNIGPMPPRVANPTTYTMVFQVTNSSNDIKNTVLTTTLPPYVNWKYVVAPSLERNNISFDSTARKMIWRIGDLRAGLGVGNLLPREISVQVELTPSISQLGRDVELTSDVILSGTDLFTGTELNFKESPLRNQLSEREEQGANGVVSQ